VQLTFGVTDPWKGNPVTKFAVIHEKLFHAFIVSEDLEFFAHGHPAFGKDVFPSVEAILKHFVGRKGGLDFAVHFKDADDLLGPAI